ncbi:MAG: radical SAM protein [Planctomycetota bacterium]
MSRVALTEINIYENMIPLISGYLQAYACKDPEIRRQFEFQRYATTVKADESRMVRDLLELKADVYAFSCYVWNMGLTRRLLARLLRERPDATYLLGGHQVMNHAHKYVAPRHENVYVANGEGEETFYRFLQAFAANRSDFDTVRGLSFYRDGELMTTPPQEKISDLTTVPSPFLAGLFNDRRYAMSIFETNRGCPYQCSFCTWGGPGLTVFKFEQERVFEEVTWLARAGVFFLYLADANWGMLPRDVDISRHIARCKQQYGVPQMVYYAAAKNKPRGSVACIEVFHEAGVVTSQAVGVQSMNEGVLTTINRANIKNSKFVEMFDALREKGISSYTELMWPLPGETRETFRQGVAKLCEIGTGCVIIYPVLLINNAELTARRGEFGLVTTPSPDDADDAEIVIATKDVSTEEYLEGMWFFYSVHSLFNAKSLPNLARYLHENGIASYDALFQAFASFCRAHPEYSFARTCSDTLARLAHYDLLSLGRLVHGILHAERKDFSDLLLAFAAAQPWWDLEEARALFEIELLNRPYIYADTPIYVDSIAWEHVRPRGKAGRRQIAVELSEVAARVLRKYLPVEDNAPASHTFVIDHQRSQLPLMPTRSLEHHASYCHGMIQRSRSLLPTWKAHQPEVPQDLGTRPNPVAV